MNLTFCNPFWRNILAYFTLVFLLSSCVSQSKLEYLKTNKKNPDNNENILEHLIKPNDELFIQISSLDDSGTNLFSSSNSQITNISPYGASLISYVVDKEGNLELPLIGKITVKDKTIAQVSAMIKDSLNNILNQPNVTVKLLNRYVTILGEVRNPGHYLYSQDNLSVFNALGLAGDITEYGNRKKIVLLRNENGANKRYDLDLTNSNFLASKLYTMQPNDIIYVKPMHNKFWSMHQFPLTILLSSISTTILIINVIQNN